MKADPLAALREMPRELIPAAIALLVSRLADYSLANSSTATPIGAGMLSPAEAAMRLGVSRRWVWDHADRLGAVKLSRTMMRIPLASIERELQAR